jgi:inositol-pentakisphosphate 2-kinase
MAGTNTLELSLDSMITLEYLAEGTANVVYRIVAPPPSPSTAADLNFESDGSSHDVPLPSEIPALRLDPRLEGRLVRLRKDLPSTVPVIESQTYLENLIVPLFTSRFNRGFLVQQILFRPSRDLIRECNAKLREMEAEGSRSRKRHYVYLVEDEDYGTLVTDMSAGTDDYYACVEFKPKWLAQSPSAPAGSKRCRTCALWAMKSTTEENSKSSFCPLNLISGDKVKVTKAVSIITSTPKHSDTLTEPARAALVDFLYNSPLLNLLKKLQIEKDPLGVLRADLLDQDFLTAMTLRDCTLFLKVCRPQRPSLINPLLLSYS